MRWTIRIALAALLVILLAPSPAEAQRRDRNRITQEEILAEKSLTTTYDIVKMLRPQWFRVSGARTMRGSGSAETQVESAIVLYVDGVKMPSLELMNSVPPARVKEVRYLAPRDAHLRYGMGHESGVVELTSVRIENPG